MDGSLNSNTFEGPQNPIIQLRPIDTSTSHSNPKYVFKDAEGGVVSRRRAGAQEEHLFGGPGTKI